MKKNRRHTIAAVTAGLIAGGAVGFVAGVPALTSAADVTTDSTVDSAEADHDHGERRGPGGRGGEQLATVAEVIGVDAEALHEAFAAGQSVADVAEANGVALDDVVAAVVAEMETHIAEHVAEGKLAQSEADAKLADAADKVAERLSSVPAERGMGDEGERRGPGGRGGEQWATVADVIGLEVHSLREAFAAGQSVADVAEANGVAFDYVVAAVVAEMETHIAEHVAEGKLTQEEADAKLADAADKVAERLSSVPAERGMGERGMGDHGGRRGPGGRGEHGPHGIDHDEAAEVTTNA